MLSKREWSRRTMSRVSDETLTRRVVPRTLVMIPENMRASRRKGVRASSRYLTYLGLALPAWNTGRRDAPPLLRVLASGIPLAPSPLLGRRIRSRVRVRSVVVLHYRSWRMAGEVNCGGMAGRALTGLNQRDINQRPVDRTVCRGSALYLAGSTWLAKDREVGALESAWEWASHWAGEG
jgi:hypothetical protein